jgi:hypothetical protein
VFFVLLCGVFDDFPEQFVASQSSPFLFGVLGQFEDHGQAGDSGAAAFGFLCPQPHRGEGGFDRIGGADVYPVFGRKLVEGQ